MACCYVSTVATSQMQAQVQIALSYQTSQAIPEVVLGMQSVKQGEEDFKAFRKIMSDMLVDIKRRGEPPETDTTIAAHLLRIRDPASGWDP